MTIKITEKTYKAIRILIESKTPYKEIADYMNVSVASVQRVATSETYEEYKAQLGGYYYKKKAEAAKAEAMKKAEKKEYPKDEPPVQVVEHRQNVTIQATHYMMTEMQKTNELLTLISNKLAFIIDELTGPVKKEA